LFCFLFFNLLPKVTSGSTSKPQSTHQTFGCFFGCCYWLLNYFFIRAPSSGSKINIASFADWALFYLSLYGTSLPTFGTQAFWGKFNDFILFIHAVNHGLPIIVIDAAG